MDNLTHTLTGLALSRAGLDRLSPYAAWVAMLAANAPDIDIVTRAGGSLSYLAHHRGISHAIVTTPVLALACVAVVRLIARRPIDWKRNWLVAMAGLASHLLFDWVTIYGTRLLLPFSPTPLRLDLTFIVDPWIWAVLLFALLAPALSRMVGSEIGERGRNRTGFGFAVFALGFLLVYHAGRAVLHERAIAVLDSHVYEGTPPGRVAAFPTIVNPFEWRGLVETSSFHSFHTVNLLGSFDPSAGEIFYKPEANPAIDVARATPVFQTFLEFSQFPHWTVTPASDLENGIQVQTMDLRFGTPAQPRFIATAILDSNLRVQRAWFQYGLLAPR